MIDRAVTLIECPRDALQGLPRQVPTRLKIELLQALLAAGLRRLDCASFVSPRAVPQMADSEAVLAAVGAPPPDTELLGIVLNRRGLERALQTSVTTLGFPLSVSPTFQWDNAHQTLIEAHAMAAALQGEVRAAGRRFVVYLSMAFGNPHGDPYSVAAVIRLARQVAEMGVTTLSLADTVGLASAEAVAGLFQALQEELDSFNVELGLHLHSRPDSAAAKITAAYRAGCRRFDSALAGLGGCPFAGDALVGNIATETALAALRACGAPVSSLVPTDPELSLAPALRCVRQLRETYGRPA